MKSAAPSTVVDRDILPFVQKPQRYAGLELNRIVKREAEVRWALAFPDLYEIGMSWLGLQILYHRINSSLTEVACERVFLPADDAAARFRALGLPLCTLETRTPLPEVDILGISLSYEMAMPGVLEILDLGRIPLTSSQRGEGDPIVIAGGPVMYNPEPLADFLDLVVIGEGEEVVVEISRIVLRGKREGWGRAQIVSRLADLPGVYRPGAHGVVQGRDGRLLVGNGKVGKVSLVHGLTVPVLLPEYYPSAPLLPLTEVTFDRLSLEIMRGCTRGCRFCQAGTLYRPVRERLVSDIVEQAIANVAATGHEELSITSLSTSDYGALPELIPALQEAFAGGNISLAFPSLRPDSFTPEMARAFPEGRKGGITFAPEAGTQRLRDVINKNSREEDLLRATALAFSEGYTSVKLYFMIGLPGEREEDLHGIADLAACVLKTRVSSGQKVSVSVSPFAPKPHTPFQRVAQDQVDLLNAKLRLLRERFRGIPVRFTGHDPVSSLFESALARGDRRLGAVLQNVWRSGGKLEAWNDRFSPERWYQAFRDAGLDPESYVAEIPGESPLPWGHVSKGVSNRFQQVESLRSERERGTPDCREGRCQGCGLMEFIPEGERVCNLYPATQSAPQPAPQRTVQGEIQCVARVRYRRRETMRWTGHLDMVRLWGRLLRRSGLPMAYSQGFHPHPRLAFSPPLPVGLCSEDEYVDIELTASVTADQLVEGISSCAPEGLEVLEVAVSSNRQDSLAARVERMEYRLPKPNGATENRLRAFLDAGQYLVERRKGERSRQVDIRPLVEKVDLSRETDLTVRLKVENGSTARVEELEAAWGYEDEWRGRAVRTAMLIECDKGWCRPIDTITDELTRVKGVAG